MQIDQRVRRGHRLELIGCGDEGKAGIARDFPGDPLAELRMGVEPGADRRPANRELERVRQRRGNVRTRMPELRRVALELLTERPLRRVLQVRAADLDDVDEL